MSQTISSSGGRTTLAPLEGAYDLPGGAILSNSRSGNRSNSLNNLRSNPSSHGNRGDAQLMRQSSASLNVTQMASQLNLPGYVNMGVTSNLSEADTIKVAVRVRPLFPHELEKGAVQVLQVAEDNSCVKVVVPGPAGNKMQRDFAFHACLGPDVDQGDVLHMCGIPQLLDAALSGYNVTVFAYGQTGSGKTFTMSGQEEIICTDNYRGGDSSDGIMSRAVGYLYQQLRERRDQNKYSISANYLEIYNEGIYDLLNLKAKNLPVKWDATQGFYVPGLKTVPCNDLNSMMEIIRMGMKHRHVGSHELNIESSRSHSIMTVSCCVTSTDPNSFDFGTPKHGKISFVDLAGSERLKDSKSEGVMAKETANINKSLFVLGKVISALAERDTSGISTAHIPYRDSKLTKLLMDSLGGCAMALMIACCSPSSLHVEETLSTLGYATRAKNIQNRPVVQYDPKEQQIAALRREIDLLRQENFYLREQLQGGGLNSQTPSCVPTSVKALPPQNWDEEDGEQAVEGRPPSVTFGGVTSVEWPSLSHYPSAPTPHHSSFRPPLNQQQQQQAQGDASSASRQLKSPLLIRSTESPRTSVSFSTSGGPSSTWSILEPGGGHQMPLRSSSTFSNQGLQLPQSSSRPPSSNLLASASGPTSMEQQKQKQLHLSINESEMQKRLRETQSLLSRFSEENTRLAKENDKLVRNRAVMSVEHADVLDEIEQLRGQLVGFESAVVNGQQSPSVIKMLLSNIKQPSSASGSASRSLLGDMPSSNSPPSMASLPFSSLHGQQQQQSLLNSSAGGELLQQLLQQQSLHNQLQQQLLQLQLLQQQQQQPGRSISSPMKLGVPERPPSSINTALPPPSPKPPPPLVPQPPSSSSGASAPPRRSSGNGQQLLLMMTPSQSSPSPFSSNPQREVADVMTIGGSTQAAMRTRGANSTGKSTGYGANATQPASSGGIIVADSSKLSLLLGGSKGGGGVSGTPTSGLNGKVPTASPSNQAGSASLSTYQQQQQYMGYGFVQGP
ncbi:hypothetical protein CEUSTIGMA_g10874.t1 [Chlamydomonas eustigma]|uniref:Kinesin motor domain-containing protein n=1 Tax=Chlamydomonas eustigma TaxID=1157962 RepID=A0A250XKJ1_9CHLO|nr:hypothetical protein CEUSTIGMA_g10874.t1 [Chlamydomonas eustigma]|eukprot:GAX83449.1 hypothetical protein CEUSTIGMA_g10874.t1 [Chlamydomonas eustigma]